METKEYRTFDKSEWERGPWDDEPDKMQFADEATGLPCLIVRNRSGALCGYVGVTEGHPCFEKNYDDARPVTKLDVDREWIDVHGGLTFSGFCTQGGDEGRHICHVPAPGEPDHVWWLGFDCHHSEDIGPAHVKWEKANGFDWAGRFGNQYRTIAYVKNEIAKLAQQLVAA